MLNSRPMLHRLVTRHVRAIGSVALTTLILPVALSGQSADSARHDSVSAAAARNRTLPLITTRTLRFITSEGSWISLDVSPDGKTILFELLGDLYTLPIAGGQATRITEGPAFDAMPRYSPDGTRLVFV